MILSRQKFDFDKQTLIEKVTLKPPFRYKAIFQDEGCFLYMSGTKSSIVSPIEKIEINTEEAVLLKCGTYFVDWIKESGASIVQVYAVHLYPVLLKRIYKNDLPSFIKGQQPENFVQKLIPENTIRKFIENLDFYFEHPSLVNEDLLELKIKELILLLIQTKNAASVIQLMSELFTPRAVSIREVVNAHILSDLSLSELAKLCNLSLSSFKREFKTIYDDSPGNYIQAKRLEKARELLKVSDLSISSIANEIGYGDPSYFSRIFKKTFGVPPSSFR